MTMNNNSEKIAILIDSGCDVSHELIEKYNMKVLRLHVLYPEKDYSDDHDIDPQMIYDRFPDEIPTTSTPSPQEVRDMVAQIKSEGFTHILSFAISSGLSGTYNTVCGVLNEETELKSFVLDTKSISTGAGIIAIWAAKQMEEGRTFAELTEVLPRKVKDSKVFYYMDTLTYLQKGGRIGLVASIVGGILNLKPIISCNDDGVYCTIAKIRGAKQALSKLLMEAKAAAGSEPCWIILLHGNGEEAAGALRPKLLAEIPNGSLIMEKQITASLAVHTGPGLVGIIVLKL